MTPCSRLKLHRLQTVHQALALAARDAWAIGKLKEAGALYARADIAESRAHYFELDEILKQDGSLAK